MRTTDKNKLLSKDLITIAIFSTLLAALVFAGSMMLGMTPVTYPFSVAVVLIPCGIIWTYLRVKVPKRLGIMIQCTVLSLLMFLVGAGWFIAVSILLGGAVAEWIAGTGKYTDFKRNTAAYAAFGVILNVGCFSLILFASDYYYNYCITNGMDAGYMDTLMKYMSPQMLLLTTVLSIIGAILGMLLGKAMLKKHFIKAGIA